MANTLSLFRYGMVLLLAMSAGVGSAASDPVDMDNRVKACAACHGENGHANPQTYYPSLAGKPTQYLYRQLLDFRDGRRHQIVMQQMLAYLSDGYLREIAAYYAAQPVVGAPARAGGESMNPGRRLVEQGDAARGLPSCVSCHGKALLGVEPAIPGLVGLRSEYISAQLGAWRVGARQGASPDCMATIARRLSPDEIGAISSWIAGLAAPPAGRAAPSSRAKLPLDCGGV
jgi:cytochrome c553